MNTSWTETEKTVWHQLSFGEIADLCPGANIDINNVADWNQDRIIRAIFIRQLCTVSDFLSKLQPHGIRIRCCKIEGVLELKSLNIPLNISLCQCLISDGFNIENSIIKSVDLSGSKTGPINADGLTVLGDLRLSDGFVADGSVCLMGAKVKGDLICTRGCFDSQNSKISEASTNRCGKAPSKFNCGDCRSITLNNYSLVLERSRIEGSLYLCDGFSALRGVHLGDSTIDGNLNCSNGKFSSKVHINSESKSSTGRRLSCYSESEFHIACAFNAEGLHVKRNLLLNNVYIEGEMRLTGAFVEGDLDSAGGVFKNQQANAIYGDRLHVQGNVFFCDSFQAEGVIRLPRARIGADLSFYKGELNSSAKTSLDANLPVLNCEGIRVNGSVFLQKFTNGKGYINLSYATIGGNLNCASSQFENKGEYAIIAQGMNIDGTVFLCTQKETEQDKEGRFRANATINLTGSRVGMDLICTNGEFHCSGSSEKSRYSIVATNMSIGGRVEMNEIEAFWGIKLNNTKIGNNLDFAKSKIHAWTKSRDEMAISAGKIVVGGSIYLDRAFNAEGEVMLNDASIGRNLCLNDGKIENKGDFTLNAVQMKVAGSIKMNRFISYGEIKINSTVIGGNVECIKGIFHNADPLTDRRKEESTPDDESEKQFSFMAIGTKTEGCVWFKETDIIGVVSFQGAKVGRDFLWKKIKNRPNFSLFMDSAIVGVLDDDCESWPDQDNLQVNDFVYQFFKQVDDPEAVKKRLEKWLSLSKHFRTQPYEHLASVLKRSGHEEEAKWVLIKKHNEQNGIKPSIWREYLKSKITTPLSAFRKILDWCYYALVGYGYKPFRAARIGLLIIFFSSIIFYWGFENNLMVKKEINGGYQIANLENENNRVVVSQVAKINFYSLNKCTSSANVTDKTGFYYFFYSLDTFLPIVDFQTAEYWLPTAYPENKECIKEFSWGGWILCIVRWIVIASGWIVTSVFVTALSGIIRK